MGLLIDHGVDPSEASVRLWSNDGLAPCSLSHSSIWRHSLPRMRAYSCASSSLGGPLACCSREEADRQVERCSPVPSPPRLHMPCRRLTQRFNEKEPESYPPWLQVT